MDFTCFFSVYSNVDHQKIVYPEKGICEFWLSVRESAKVAYTNYTVFQWIALAYSLLSCQSHNGQRADVTNWRQTLWDGFFSSCHSASPDEFSRTFASGAGRLASCRESVLWQQEISWGYVSVLFRKSSCDLALFSNITHKEFVLILNSYLNADHLEFMNNK